MSEDRSPLETLINERIANSEKKVAAHDQAELLAAANIHSFFTDTLNNLWLRIQGQAQQKRIQCSTYNGQSGDSNTRSVELTLTSRTTWPLRQESPASKMTVRGFVKDEEPLIRISVTGRGARDWSAEYPQSELRLEEARTQAEKMLADWFAFFVQPVTD